MYDKEVRVCSEIVNPDNSDNKWATPQGRPVLFANGKAYWIPAQAVSGKKAVLLEKLSELNSLYDKINESDENPILEFSKKVENLTLIALGLQYSDETISKLLEDDGLDSSIYNEILMVIGGKDTSYKLDVKKKFDR